MKKIILKACRSNSTFRLLSIIAFSFAMISCEKEETPLESSQLEDMALYEFLEQNSGEDNLLKKPAPKKGDEAIALIAINGGFDELVQALVFVDEELDAGLVDLFLNGKDQYTVFAPTDAAFEELYAALGITSIDELPAELVLEVLLYHVTEGRRASNSVVPRKNLRTIETLAGETFTVNSAGMITAVGNTANILAADISASNGIIHVIDSVILPID